MPGSAFINFLCLMLTRHRARHLAVFVLAVLIVALCSAVMFLSSALQRDIAATLEAQADLTVQRMRGGKAVDLPLAWAEDFALIPGVRTAVPRVFGRYFHEPNGAYFTVVGIDPFAPRISRALQELVDGLDLRRFLERDNMIVGGGVKQFLADNYYTDSYTFRSPDMEPVEVFIHDVLPADSDLVGNDLAIMEIDLARRILGVAADRATDIVLFVPNELERDAVMGKLIQQHYDIRVIRKTEIETVYRNLFNYKGGVFLSLFLVVLATFVLILYQRYSLITGADRREIGILRAVGWSIGDVIGLKVAESMVVGLTAWLLGVVLAYLYVFVLPAPLLGSVFYGFGNMPVDYALGRMVDPGQLALLFLFFLGPFATATLIPVWRVAVTDPVEAMK